MVTTMKRSQELDNFNAAMNKILKADPKVVKEQMEAEKHEREEQRKAKRASADRASNDKD